jgi:hypothetical protein
MSKVKFIYGNNKYEISFKDKKSIKDVIEEYVKLLFIKKKDLIFLYKGKNISEKTDLLNKLKKDNIVISVFKRNNAKQENELESIICPECKILASSTINNAYININNCINKHNNKYSINAFIDSQSIEDKEVKCNICQNSQNLYHDNFYICTCNINICQLCMTNHIRNNKNHNILYYNKRFFTCNKHNIDYISYCSNCNINLCEKCENEHSNHKIKIILYKKEINEKLNDKKKNEIEKEIKEKK